MYTRGAFDRAMAAAIFGISRLGSTLVYSEPGPIRIRSAWSMASTAAGRGRTRLGERLSLLIGSWLALMRVSPCTTRPFSSVATR